MKKILFAFIVLLLLTAILFYYGFTDAFRNFSGNESWRALEKYELNARKKVIEQKIYELAKNDPSAITIADSGSGFRTDGWLTIAITDYPDTITYTLRFAGNDSIWNSRGISEILLMKINNKTLSITYPTLRKTNKKSYKKMLSIFESRVIDSLKKKRNPE